MSATVNGSTAQLREAAPPEGAGPTERILTRSCTPQRCAAAAQRASMRSLFAILHKRNMPQNKCPTPRNRKRLKMCGRGHDHQACHATLVILYNPGITSPKRVTQLRAHNPPNSYLSNTCCFLVVMATRRRPDPHNTIPTGRCSRRRNRCACFRANFALSLTPCPRRAHNPRALMAHTQMHLECPECK